ncbi:hypothetical protein DCMF_26735 [Candidatus Formimonas warabiya]|uniref:PAS domain-containing protein n=2 Tax=Formimonas warabiya TaxID=1761012 RepID=A0A3G1KZB4_FORW1|nr:hypothetical protein DCMF_26735 [Candidatus Formimonas warabiya]
MSNLLKMRNFIEQVSDAIASVLELDVVITDKDLFRVAATGMYRNRLSQRVNQGCATANVIIGKKCIVTASVPGDICQHCTRGGKCQEKAHIIQPIVVDDECEGVIGLLAFDERQKNIIIKQQEKLLLYTEKMAALISSTLKEQEILKKNLLITNKLKMTLNTVDEGLIYVDNKRIVTQINEAALEMLGIAEAAILDREMDECRIKRYVCEVLNEGVALDDREIVDVYQGKKIHVFITIKPILGIDDQQEGAVLILKEYAKIEKIVSNVTGIRKAYFFKDIIGVSEAINEVKNKAIKVAKIDSTVLLTGESGTGKEMFAGAIHQESHRSTGPFISINCAAIPETLLESELFGYEEGAFSGAKKGGKPGKFQLAHGGTLFLDEIGDMPLYLQTKLLRAIQEKTIDKVGGTRPVEVNVRIIAATNKNLEDSIAKGEFRKDLFYRLNVIPLNIPPLRERPEDIYPLVNIFKNKHENLLKKNVIGFSNEVMNIFYRYSWPGNVRELENVVEYMLSLASSEIIGSDSLPHKLKNFSSGYGGKGPALLPLAEVITKAEESALKEAVACAGNHLNDKEILDLCRQLKISRATFYRKAKKYHLLSL